MKRTCLIVAVGFALLAQPMGAQERLGSGAPDQQYRAGWTFTPTIGVAETYDTNVSLFSEGHQGNDDYVATVFPGADLHYIGQHSMLDVDYSGSFLDYRTYPALNRWEQRAKLELRHQQSAHLAWFGHGAAALLPTTDLIDLGGIPYRQTGAKTADARGGVEYAISGRDLVTQSLSYQVVAFDRPDATADILRGGRILESMTTWRRKVSARAAVGADYSFRRAIVSGDVEPFDFHTTEAAVDYALSPMWSVRGGAGVVYLQQTSLTDARVGPAWRIAFERQHARTTFHVGYLRTFIPSFGFGGTVQAQDAGIGFRMPLFHARRVYLDSSAVFRDNQPLTANGVISDPLTGVVEQLPLRSLRTHTILGWEPQPWVRLEVFHSLVQQTSLHVGGYIARNRVGFQIVTSKPMRMQ
ncbi:MAG: hypothetical protein JWL71_1529 [Acidobacteria bacterium]|nr:hypothetical protein [Acidobacteriota bacterium]